MKKAIYFVLSFILGFTILTIGLAKLSTPAEASFQNKEWLCHNGETVKDYKSNHGHWEWYGWHLVWEWNEGHDDYEGKCKPPPVDMCPNLEGNQETDKECPPEATPSPSPEPCKENCGVVPTFPHDQGAPVCTNGKVLELAANVHVLRSGDKATVNWFRTGGDKASVYYKEVSAENWQHSVPEVDTNNRPDNFVSVEVGGLDPNLGYTFGVEQRNGCGGGELATSVVVDGPQTMLFPFNFWMWSK